MIWLLLAAFGAAVTAAAWVLGARGPAIVAAAAALLWLVGRAALAAAAGRRRRVVVPPRAVAPVPSPGRDAEALASARSPAEVAAVVDALFAARAPGAQVELWLLGSRREWRRARGGAIPCAPAREE
ncbi:MAG TPA: hypothetical protein VFU21_23620, partial [Kofleriaceae bacterium]|nr:hypothetical protein [Kofleriaceae bacterium]